MSRCVRVVSEPSDGSRYPHHDTTSAGDAIEAMRTGGVPDELIARMMGGWQILVTEAGTREGRPENVSAAAPRPTRGGRARGA